MGRGALGAQRPLGLALYRIVLGGHRDCNVRAGPCDAGLRPTLVTALYRTWENSVTAILGLPKRQADTTASGSDIPGDGGGDDDCGDDDGGDDDCGDDDGGGDDAKEASRHP